MIERKIIIGLITSTEYCFKVKSIWDSQYLESGTAKQLAGWCWEYFDKYEKAPGRDIEGIYYRKLKENKIPKEIAEEFEVDILPSLSNQSDQEPLNLPYLLEETEFFFNGRHLTLFKESLQALLAKGMTEEAEKLALEFKPLGKASINLADFIRTAPQIRKTKKNPIITYMHPWLKGGQTTIIYGNYGSGKSLLTILIGYLLGLSEEDLDKEEAEIGQWIVRNPTGCLYIDGELGEKEMEERISGYEWIGQQRNKYKMRVLSIPEYQLATEDQFYLSDRENQVKIIKWLKDHPDYKVVVLDSVSTLFGLQEENDNSEWNNKVNPLLRDLRAMDVACLLLHHAGKNDKKGLRGASAMGAMAHNIFRLTNHPKKDVDGGEAWFIIGKDKQRAGGKGFRTFAVRFYQEEDGKETHWVITKMSE